MQIVFTPPDENSPGYLRRLKKIIAFQEAIKDKQVTPALMDKMVDFLAEFVTDPPTKPEAVEALWEASQSQIFDLFATIGGGADNFPLSDRPPGDG